jgi:hypothetical protein
MKCGAENILLILVYFHKAYRIQEGLKIFTV